MREKSIYLLLCRRSLQSSIFLINIGMFGIVIALLLLLLAHIKPIMVFSLAIMIILRRIFNAVGYGVDPDSRSFKHFVDSISSNASAYADTFLGKLYDTYLLVKDWPWQSIFILLSFFIWFSQGFFKVDASEKAMVLRFGAFNREVGPGMRWRIPIFEIPIVINVTRVNNIHKFSKIVTNDQGIVDVQVTVFFTVDPYRIRDFKFTARSPESILSSITDSIMREVVAHKKAEDCLTTARQSIEMEIRAKLEAKLAEYKLGLLIQGVQIGAIDPPDSVLSANRSVADAQCEYTAKKNEAEAHYNEVVPKAKGRAAQCLQEASIEAQRIRYDAESEISSFMVWLKQWEMDPKLTKAIIESTMAKCVQGARITTIPDSVGLDKAVISRLLIPSN